MLTRQLSYTFLSKSIGACAWASLFLRWALLLLCAEFGVEVWLVLANSHIEDLQAASPDEMLFIEVVNSGSPWGFAAGYGPVFWLLTYSIFHFLPIDNAVIVGRVLFIVLKYTSWLVFSLVMLNSSKKSAALFLWVALITPGYFFFGKIISPEYLLLFFATISMCFLYKDAAKFGSNFFCSLFFASLAAATKITAAPMIVIIYIFGLLCPIYFYRDIKASLRNGFYGLSILVLFWGPLVFYCGLTSSIAQINDALSIVPPSEFNFEVLKLAWFRDMSTWDQIMLGGIGVDFLPIFFLFVVSMFCTAAFAKGAYLTSTLSIAFCAFISSAIMLFVTIVHQSTYSWYIFLPFQLMLISSVILFENQENEIYAFIFVALLALFFTHDAERIFSRLRFKYNSNEQVESNAKVMGKIQQYLLTNVPCARNGHLDILVPYNGRELNVLPMRVSLNHRITNKWNLPDFLVLNKKLYSNGLTPLTELVVKEDFKSFVKLEDFDMLQLYVNKNISCLHF